MKLARIYSALLDFCLARLLIGVFILAFFGIHPAAALGAGDLFTASGVPIVKTCSSPITDPGIGGAVAETDNIIYQANFAPYPFQRFDPEVGSSLFLSRDVRMDIIQAKGAPGPRPLLIVIHGGAWRKYTAPNYILTPPQKCDVAGTVDPHNCGPGRNATCFSSLVQQCVLRKDARIVAKNLGITTAIVEYPLRAGAQKDDIPSQVASLFCAVRYLTANASAYGIDPARIAWQGYSAGGHLAALMALLQGKNADANVSAAGFDSPKCAYNSQKLQPAVAAIPYYGFYNGAIQPDMGFFSVGISVVHPGLPGVLPGQSGWWSQNSPLIAKYSPINYIDANSPPIFIARGQHDNISTFQDAAAMYNAAVAKNVKVALIQAPKLKHGYGPFFKGNYVHAQTCSLIRFYKDNLKP